MDLRYLHYFVVTAEELNFTRAAQRLHIAQPSLSVQVRKLEAEVGVELLSREGRGIRLTEAGRIFLAQAQKTLVEANRGVALAHQAAHGEIGQLSIGYNTAAEFQAFPKIVPAFKKKWPQVHLNLQSLKVSQQLEQLRRDELDVGFVWLPIPTEEFDVEELSKESLIAAVPASHRLASLPAISIRDLSGEPLILPTRRVDAETHQQIEQLFTRAGATMNVVYELETLLSVTNFIAMGSACSIVADYARRIRWKGVVYKPLRPTIVKTLALIKVKGRAGLADTFYRFAAKAIRSRNSDQEQG